MKKKKKTTRKTVKHEEKKKKIEQKTAVGVRQPIEDCRPVLTAELDLSTVLNIKWEWDSVGGG